MNSDASHIIPRTLSRVAQWLTTETGGWFRCAVTVQSAVMGAPSHKRGRCTQLIVSSSKS